MRYCSVLCIATALVACQPTTVEGHMPIVLKRSHVGTVLGAAGGAALGSQIGKGVGNIAAIATGTLLGSLVGHDIGATLDRFDQALLQDNLYRSLEYGRAGRIRQWRNPQTGVTGNITVTQAVKHKERYCREYQREVQVGGRKHRAYGTACRMPDGSWQLQ